MRVPKPSGRHSGMVRRRRAVRCFVVAEESMLPTLRPGDGLIAVRSRRARAGQIRVFEHPARPSFWLVKRVSETDGGRFVAVSDHECTGVVDSRSFGPVLVAGSYRVVLRVPGRFIGRRSGGPSRNTA